MSWSRLINFDTWPVTDQVTSKHCLAFPRLQTHSSHMFELRHGSAGSPTAQFQSIKHQKRNPERQRGVQTDGWDAAIFLSVCSRDRKKISVCNLCVFMCVCFGGEGRKWGFAAPDWLASVALAALRSACRAICDWVPAKAPRLPVAARQHSVTRYVWINKTLTHTDTRTDGQARRWLVSFTETSFIALNETKPVNRWRRRRGVSWRAVEA